MNGIRLFAIISLICSSILSSAFSSTEEGWKQLYENRHDKARELFSNAQPSEESHLGLMLCDLAQGDALPLTHSLAELIQLYPNSSYLDAYLSIMEINDVQGWKASDQLSILQNAVEKTSNIQNKQEIYNKIATLQSMLLADETTNSASKAGVLLNHWNVVGLFGAYGSPDYFHPFGPEVEIKESYPGWQKEVRFQALDEVHNNGWIVFDGLFYPRAGVAYTVNVMESMSSGAVQLVIESETDIRVWLNGEPVAEKTTLQHQYQNTVTPTVNLKQGKNVLIIKTTSNGGWNLRVRIQQINSNEIVWKSVPFAADDFKGLYLKPFDTVEISSSDKNVSPAKVYEKLVAALLNADQKNYPEALRLIKEAQQHAPDFALLHTLQGEVNLAQGAARPASKPRFQQAAETAYNRSLELDLASKKAVVGLLSYYLDRDQTDQALALLKEKKESNPELYKGYTGLLDYSKALMYARKGFEHESVRLMEKSSASLLPSIQIPQHLFNYYLRNNQLKKAQEIVDEALERIPGYLPYIHLAVRLGDDTGDIAAVERLIQKAEKAFPQNIEFPLSLGSLYEQQGELTKARDVYTAALDRFPNHPQPLSRLADVNTLLTEKNDTENYQALYALNPSSRKPLRVLRDAEGQEFPFQKYDVHLDDIDIKVADRWNNSRASSIYLIDMMVLVLHENGTYDQYIHQAIKILNQEGVRKWAEVVIPQGGDVEIIYGRTINPDGKEWAVSHLQDLGGQQSLSMYGIEEGSIIEFAYLQRAGNAEPGSNVYSGGYFFATEDDPMLLSKLTVVKHKQVPFHLDTNGEVNTTIKEDGDWVIYDWEKWLSDGIKPERFSPTLAKRVPSLQMTTGTDWMPFAERMRTTSYPFAEYSPLIMNRAKEIVFGAASKHEKTKLIYDWIRETIEDSSGGQTTVDTMTLQAGNRYQKIRLAHQMLESIGIESKLAVALENNENDGFRPLPFPVLQSTSVLIVPEQPGISERIVIDFSSRYSPFNQLSPALRKQMALILDEKTPYFEPLIPNLWEHGLLMKEARLTLYGNKPAAITGRYTYDHGYDEQIRQALTNPEVKQRLADAQIANDLRGVQVDESDMVDTGDLSTPPVLVFNGKLPGIVASTGGVMQVKPVLMKVQASGLVSDTTRESPVVFSGSPMHEPVSLQYDMSSFFKQNAKIELPKNRFIINEFGYYSLFYAWDGEVLHVRRSFLMPEQTISPEDYPRFVDFCREIDQAEDESIRITLPAAAG